MPNNIFIFHGTEGYPEENWFPWLKEKLENKGYKVFVPQFPSPPVVPTKIAEWFDVIKNYETPVKHRVFNSLRQLADEGPSEAESRRPRSGFLKARPLSILFGAFFI